MSYFLRGLQVGHAVLDRGRIGQAWRDRWDSLNLITPNAVGDLPGFPLGRDPRGFLTRSEFVDYLERYSAYYAAPVHTGVDVKRVVREAGGETLRLETSTGLVLARNVVVTTGHLHAPRLPSLAQRSRSPSCNCTPTSIDGPHNCPKAPHWLSVAACA
jgi:putative flavoprotein involved in K+ transport